jgi:hypothetical protein
MLPDHIVPNVVAAPLIGFALLAAAGVARAASRGWAASLVAAGAVIAFVAIMSPAAHGDCGTRCEERDDARSQPTRYVSARAVAAP